MIDENGKFDISTPKTMVELLTETNLRSCSLAARGLWMEVFGLMTCLPPYGYLVLPEPPPKKGTFSFTTDLLAAAVKSSESEVAALLTELESVGALRRTVEGVIYSPKLVQEGIPEIICRKMAPKRRKAN